LLFSSPKRALLLHAAVEQAHALAGAKRLLLMLLSRKLFTPAALALIALLVP